MNVYKINMPYGEIAHFEECHVVNEIVQDLCVGEKIQIELIRVTKEEFERLIGADE